MEFVKKFIPETILKIIRPFYHGALALLANRYFGHPSRSMVVVGITGTGGKSTTAQMLARILNQDGKKCGLITTVSYFDGDKEHINKHGLSMPGGWLLQKQLFEMKSKGCEYAVVECTSEGLAQNRHLGINFHMGIFTNLSPAHLEAHGGFNNYMKAKGKLFEAVSKAIHGTILVNIDDPNAGYFLSSQAKEKYCAGFNNWQTKYANLGYLAKITQNGFMLNGIEFQINLLGNFNKYNALLAASAAHILGVNLGASSQVLASFNYIRGRMEEVPNDLGIRIIVDYAPEPGDMLAVLSSLSQMPHKRIIHVFGATGGHRDKIKRFEFGKISAQYASEIIITNDDIYNSDPEEIAMNIELGIKDFEQGESLKSPESPVVINRRKILDRREAIYEALRIAEDGDIVLVTGKGSEQFLVLPRNKRVEWDEVRVVKQLLNEIPKDK